MSLYQTKFYTLYNGTIYDHLRFVPYAQSDNLNNYQVNDNKETPDSHSSMRILAMHERMGVG